VTRRAGDPPVAALATPAGASEAALVRVSGAGCRALVASIFTARTPSGDEVPAARRGGLEIAAGTPAIPAIAVEYPPGRSYTGEEAVELILPGAPALVRGLLARLESLGIGPAGPGEFTRRAFLGGRFDLTRAESVAALIAADDLDQARAARRTLDGELAGAVREIGDRLHDAIALLEAGLDFAEHEVDPPAAAEIDRLLAPIAERLEEWVGRPDAGSAPSPHPRFLIWGRTNAGKSTLLNALCGESRALVSPHPGTTTDAIGGELRTPAGTVELLDLPGRKEELSAVEARADALARRELAEGDRILYLLDSSRDPGALLAEWSGLPDEVRGRAWPVLSQIDRVPAAARGALPAWPEVLLCSALTGEGLGELRERIAAAREGGSAPSRGLARLFNDRQRRRLLECGERLRAARAELAASGRVEPELVVVDLRRAHEALEEITGGIAPEETLERIFARFCIGK
jgi:tRNA modification GTPase